MNDDPAIEADIDGLAKDIWNKRKNFLQKKRESYAFIRTEHNSKETTLRLLDIREKGIEIDEIKDVLEDPSMPPIYKERAEQLSKQCEELYKRKDAIEVALSDDLTDQRLKEGKSRSQLIAVVAPIFSITAAFAALAKASDGDAALLVEATAGGAVTGTAIVFHKDIRNALRTSKETICGDGLRKRLGDAVSNIEEKGNAKIYDFKKASRSTASQIIEAKRKVGERVRSLSVFKR